MKPKLSFGFALNGVVSKLAVRLLIWKLEIFKFKWKFKVKVSTFIANRGAFQRLSFLGNHSDLP